MVVFAHRLDVGSQKFVIRVVQDESQSNDQDSPHPQQDNREPFKKGIAFDGFFYLLFEEEKAHH